MEYKSNDYQAVHTYRPYKIPDIWKMTQRTNMPLFDMSVLRKKQDDMLMWGIDHATAESEEESKISKLFEEKVKQLNQQ